ncbi:glycosyltransferase family 2 protein [Egbenema bharatensis]|uniref:glycosyltransferase family 2 protein n=1 Tax=Egbenema bharatensis TaxID=3463334 RepID=UPI003A890F01
MVKNLRITDSSDIQIAVLLTCFNRKQNTIDCLTALHNQILPEGVKFSVYLVDDGSTDGTASAVQEAFPSVNIISGDGCLFWNGGMRRAFTAAAQHAYDYHLWLNDDTLLAPTALSTLLATSQVLWEQEDASTTPSLRHAIIVGAIQDPDTGKHTYGGHLRTHRLHPFKYRMVIPNGKPQRCQMMNGNCVLIPQSVFRQVGNLDPAFSHSYGDFDYALRAERQGCSVWTTPGYVGTCKRNPPQSTVWTNPNLTLKERFKRVNQPKGLPFREQLVFTRRHAGWLWPFFWLLPYARLCLSALQLSSQKRTVQGT